MEKQETSVGDYGVDSAQTQNEQHKPLLLKILMVPATWLNLQLYGMVTMILYVIAVGMYFALSYSSAPQLQAIAVILAAVLLVLYAVAHVICIGSFYISCKGFFDHYRKAYMVVYLSALALMHAVMWVLILLVYTILLLFVL